MSRSRITLFAAAGAVLAAGIVLPLACRRGAPLHERARRWTPADLHAALTAAGLDYEGKPVPHGGEANLWGGYYLRPAGSREPWEAMAALRPELFASRPGRLCVTVVPGQFLEEMSPDSGYLQVRHLTVRGHPDELRRVAAALAHAE